MAVDLHFVNEEGCVIECILGIVHVMDTTILFLKLLKYYFPNISLAYQGCKIKIWS